LHRKRLPASPDDLKDARGLENPRSFVTVNVYKQIGWKQRMNDSFPLPVLPHLNRFVRREK
jgi:hypothetical protein